MSGSSVSFVIVLHAAAALAATVMGLVALYLRYARHLRLHRVAGGIWVVLMMVTALSSLGIRGKQGLHWYGFSPLHLLIPLTFGTLLLSWHWLRRGNTRAHGLTMLSLYVGACLVAGAFTLLPGRLLGNLLREWLGRWFTA